MPPELVIRLRNLKRNGTRVVVHYGHSLRCEGLIYSWTSGVGAMVWVYDPETRQDIGIPFKSIRKIGDVS